MNRTITVGAALAAAALTVILPATADAATFPACRTSQLHLSLGHERAATGHVTAVLTATDEGPACILRGFPHLGLEDTRGRSLPSRVTDTGKASAVLVLHGLSATAVVSWGSDGMTGEQAARLTVGAKSATFPGGAALIGGGQITTTAFVLPKTQR